MVRDTVLYDIKGNPVAFIQYDFSDIIYLMDGQAVAYLEHISGGSGRARIWGLNGKHLGWYDDHGIVYNAKALRVGFNRDIYKRDFKKTSPPQVKEQGAPIFMPSFSLSNSHEEFRQFLRKGIP